MQLTRLKEKNQVTIPKEIVNLFHLKKKEIFMVETADNYIKLIPVDVEPRFGPAELDALDQIVAKEKLQAKSLKPGKEFNDYIKKITG